MSIGQWFALIGVMIGLAGCRSGVEVKTGRAEGMPVEISFTSSGYVKGREVQVQSVLPARVALVLVREGDRVRPGDLLVLLDDSTLRQKLISAQSRRTAALAARKRAIEAAAAARAQIERGVEQADAQIEAARARFRLLKAGPRSQEISQAEHRVRQAEAALQEAERAFERAKPLYEEGAISQADHDRAQERQRISRAELGVAQEALKLLRAGATQDELAVALADIDSAITAQRLAVARRKELAIHNSDIQIAEAGIEEAAGAIREVESTLDDARIVAPIAGVLAKVDLEPGEMIQPGMLTIVEPDRLYIEAELGESDLNATFKGQRVEVRSASFVGTVFEGKVAQIGASAEPKPDMSLRTRIVRVRIEFTDPENRLKPGMEVDIEGSRKLKEALVIPEAALISDGAEEYVFVLQEGKARSIVVTTAERFSGKVAILKGLSGDEKLILDPPMTLKSGDSVQEVK